MLLSPAIRNRLEMQGYTCTDDAAFARVVPWLRFTPALCAALIAIGTALASPVVLWILVLLAALGAVFPRHPFDFIYNAGLRHLIGTPPLPPNGTPRRLACGTAAVWLAATAWAFGSGATMTGYVLGGILTAAGAVVSVSHFCLPSFVYAVLTARRRSGARSPGP
jgi:hypothetical protein